MKGTYIISIYNHIEAERVVKDVQIFGSEGSGTEISLESEKKQTFIEPKNILDETIEASSSTDMLKKLLPLVQECKKKMSLRLSVNIHYECPWGTENLTDAYVGGPNDPIEFLLEDAFLNKTHEEITQELRERRSKRNDSEGFYVRSNLEERIYILKKKTSGYGPSFTRIRAINPVDMVKKLNSILKDDGIDYSGNKYEISYECPWGFESLVKFELNQRSEKNVRLDKAILQKTHKELDEEYSKKREVSILESLNRRPKKFRKKENNGRKRIYNVELRSKKQMLGFATYDGFLEAETPADMKAQVNTLLGKYKKEQVSEVSIHYECPEVGFVQIYPEGIFDEDTHLEMDTRYQELYSEIKSEKCRENYGPDKEMDISTVMELQEYEVNILGSNKENPKGSIENIFVYAESAKDAKAKIVKLWPGYKIRSCRKYNYVKEKAEADREQYASQMAWYRGDYDSPENIRSQNWAITNRDIGEDYDRDEEWYYLHRNDED